MTRTAQFDRATSETDIRCRIGLDGRGETKIVTGLGFLDHLIESFAKHSGFEIELTAAGDTSVDDHHTVEDCAIAIGRCLEAALGDKQGITRFGSAYVALDEALVRVVVDLSGRPWAEIDLPFAREKVGDVATENIRHFLTTLAAEGRFALHVDRLRGSNSHHVAEAAFKALARALREAVAVDGIGVPSTKGTLG